MIVLRNGGYLGEGGEEGSRRWGWGVGDGE